MQTSSIDGCKYFVTFIDDYSRCCKVCFMKHKNEVLQTQSSITLWSSTVLQWSVFTVGVNLYRGPADISDKRIFDLGLIEEVKHVPALWLENKIDQLIATQTAAREQDAEQLAGLMGMMKQQHEDRQKIMKLMLKAVAGKRKRSRDQDSASESE